MVHSPEVRTKCWSRYQNKHIQGKFHVMTKQQPTPHLNLWTARIRTKLWEKLRNSLLKEKEEMTKYLAQFKWGLFWSHSEFRPWTNTLLRQIKHLLAPWGETSYLNIWNRIWFNLPSVAMNNIPSRSDNDCAGHAHIADILHRLLFAQVEFRGAKDATTLPLHLPDSAVQALN